MPIRKKSKQRGGVNSRKARWGGIGQRIHMKSGTKEKKMARRGRVKEVELPKCKLGHPVNVVAITYGLGGFKTVWWCDTCQKEQPWTE